MTNWKDLITDEMERKAEDWGDVVSCTLTEDELKKEFDSGYGSEEGNKFSLWTGKRVYFPATYDGSEWVESVSRHPDGIAKEHVGG